MELPFKYHRNGYLMADEIYKKLFPNDSKYIHIYFDDNREYRVIEALEEDIKRLVDNK